MTARRVRQRAERDGTQHAAARRARSDACLQGRSAYSGKCGVDLVDGAGEALGPALCLPAAELHLDGCPVSVGHCQDRIDLTPVGVAIVVYVCAQGLRVDEQVVDSCGFKEEAERFQVVVR